MPVAQRAHLQYLMPGRFYADRDCRFAILHRNRQVYVCMPMVVTVDTRCDSAWLRAFRINGSGFQLAIWTEATRFGHLQIWVDGVQYHNLTFDYYGERFPAGYRINAGHSMKLFCALTTRCAETQRVQIATEFIQAVADRPALHFNNLYCFGPGDIDPPDKPRKRNRNAWRSG